MRIKICLICALVSVTWISLLIARGLGYPADLTLIAMLMGGSVVGITYTLSKRLSETQVMPWKLTAIPLGFLIAYTALYEQWLVAGIAAAAALTLGFFFFRKSSSALAYPVRKRGLSQLSPTKAAGTTKADELEKKMKECC